ncbi:Uma2 family endonuclease [Embleya sp. AB8]|uniref:Uma2 family endonuclease n=1 Tax=Embleya sp. AB8 TaxID=3156304 RepID=UPI003C769B7A
MTTVTERVGMPVEEFERIARDTAESVRLELIGGKVGVKAMADGDHIEIVMWLVKLLARLRPELTLYVERGLQVEQYRKGRARPDGTLAHEETFNAQGEWGDPSAVLMVLEVTSFDRDTDRRDREDKPRAYAETGIPLYLLIDRDSCEVAVYSDPADGAYTTFVKRPFGKLVHLPAPVDVELETERLWRWVR